MVLHCNNYQIFVNGHVWPCMYICGMEKRKAISIKLPPELLAKLDAYCKKQSHKPTKTQVIEDAIRSVVEKRK
jgi:hypothetical protein